MRATILTAAAALTAAGPLQGGEGMAEEIPLIVAGGQLDPAFPDADVYLAEPERASVPPGKACEVAHRYVELINAGDYAGVAALYRDDATFLEPMRPTLRGRAQIDEFYTKRIGAMQPELAAVAYLGNESQCMVELALKTEMRGKPRWVLVSIDHFLVGEDGRIISMAAFARPPRSE